MSNIKSVKKFLLSGFIFLIILTSFVNFQGQEDKIMAYQQERVQGFGEVPIFVVQKNSLKGFSSPKIQYRVKERIRVIMTAYSSSVWETQGDPFITASGTRVRWGTVAANFLPFGTKIRIPSLFGEKIFIVEDRMHPRKRMQVDIWHPTRLEALEFGAKRGYIEILEEF